MKCCSSEEELRLPPSVEKGLREAGGLDVVLGRLRDERRFEALSRIHEALSDRTRLKMLAALSISDLCPCLMKRITGVADSKLSYHLKILENAGLIKSSRKGRWVIYSITKKGLEQIGTEMK